MSVLIFTRKVDQEDERAGFFVNWIDEFATKFDKVYVVCLQKGKHTFTHLNIEVFSLDQGRIRGKALRNMIRFVRLQSYLIKTLPKVEGIFVHMMPVYVLAIGILAKIYKKRIFFWYTHSKVDIWLKATRLFVESYLSASKSGFRLKTKKHIYITGHAIDENMFLYPTDRDILDNVKGIKFLTVGRISPAKNIDKIINIIFRLKSELEIKVYLDIVGAPALKSDWDYIKYLRSLVLEKGLEGEVFFRGPKKYNQLPLIYQSCDIFINMSDTGSLDKAVLEAALSGNVIFTTNHAYRDIFDKDLSDKLIAEDEEDLYKKIKKYITSTDKEEIKNDIKKLQGIVSGHHSLHTTINKIADIIFGKK